MTLRKLLKYSAIVFGAAITMLIIVTISISLQWRNVAAEGLSLAEGKAIVDVYRRSTTTYSEGFLGINFYTVDKDNSRKMYDNVMYQTDYIDLVGDLYSFSVKDYSHQDDLFMWLNYYPKSPDYLSLKNLVEVYKAWIIAGIPMTFLSEEYEWFPIANYKKTRVSGIEFPQTLQEIDKDLEYKEFKKFGDADNIPALKNEEIESRIIQIEGETPLGKEALSLNYFIIHKDDLNSVYESCKNIAEKLKEEKALLLKFSYRPHNNYYSFMWVSSLPKNYNRSNVEVISDYENILKKSILFERVIVEDSVKLWPKTFEEMENF